MGSVAARKARAIEIERRVRAIPVGFVCTYGDLDPDAPRFAGWVLASAGEDLPWHRVVRADGTLPMGERQRALLDREGVPLRGERVDLTVARLAGEPA
jgi:alkylated DNA nucleotide flippase Atl1